MNRKDKSIIHYLGSVKFIKKRLETFESFCPLHWFYVNNPFFAIPK